MAKASRPSRYSFKRILRRFWSGSLIELARAGRIAQILWDATQVQRKQSQCLIDAGRVALELLEQNKIDHPELEKAAARFHKTQRILKRQDLLLQSYQGRGDVSAVLRKDKEENRGALAPV